MSRTKKTSDKISGGDVGRALRRLAGDKASKHKAVAAHVHAMLKEIDIHMAVAKHLEEWAWPSAFWWHTPNGEKRDPATAAKLKRMGVKPGVHDFLIVHAGRIYGLELKRAGETPTSDQWHFGRMIGSTGGEWACVDSFAGAVQQLEAWNILRIKVGGQL